MPPIHQYPSVNFSHYLVIKANLPLYDGPPTYRDVIQGNVGSCWYLSAIAAYIGPGKGLAERQASLKKMIIPVGPSGNGIYAVRLEGTWYVVDDYVKAGYFSYGGENPQRVLWPILLEKAMMSIFSANSVSVKMMTADGEKMGRVSPDLQTKPCQMKRGAIGLQYIVGGSVQVRSLNKEDHSMIRPLITPVEAYTLIKRGEYVLANTWKEPHLNRPPSLHAIGAVPQHCYAVFAMDYDKLQGMYYVTIYNPWGKRPITAGKKPKAKMSLKTDPERGLFRLSWLEFIHAFAFIHHTQTV